MQLIPTQEEVIALLRETGALREGVFEYPNGLFSNQYLQVPLAFRYFQHAKTLSVALSRLIRQNTSTGLVQECGRTLPGVMPSTVNHGAKGKGSET